MNCWPADWFEQFWSIYPRKVAKKDAFRALDRVRKSTSEEVSFDRIIAGVNAYSRSVRGKDAQYICHPATWINGGRWDDEYEQAQQWTAAERWQQTVSRMRQFQ